MYWSSILAATDGFGSSIELASTPLALIPPKWFRIAWIDFRRLSVAIR